MGNTNQMNKIVTIYFVTFGYLDVIFRIIIGLSFQINLHQF